MDNEQREQLTPADYLAAGVDPPNWSEDPFPSLETWRHWRAAENQTLAHKLAMASRADHLD